MKQNLRESHVAALIREGIQQLKEQNFSNAISTFDRVIELHPVSFHAYLYRAICKHALAFGSELTSAEKINCLQNVFEDLNYATKTVENHLTSLDFL